MEPWDGPAAVCFTDGRVIGATLDRNGLRPAAGRRPRTASSSWARRPACSASSPRASSASGACSRASSFLIDLEQGRIVEDDEVKREVSTQQPYGEWYEQNTVHFSDLPEAHVTLTGVEPTGLRQMAFGYTQEDLRVLIAPMAAAGAEPTGSMGNDNALPVLSDRKPPLYSYFKQLFAQVTNPPIDPIREEIVMSLGTGVGAERNLLDESPEHATSS
jgi:glutamate synthase (NADPH/NADH) large chain/glutamate synthase (ferredoxin)